MSKSYSQMMKEQFGDMMAKTSVEDAQISSLVKTFLELETDVKKIDKHISLILFLSKLDPRFKQFVKINPIWDKLAVISSFSKL